MRFEFRLPSFKMPARAVAATRNLLRGARRRISHHARSKRGVELNPEAAPGSRPEIRNTQPESFFDIDFLRKLERLHLVAKRLSLAGPKGEHAATRRGFSLEFSDYRRYQHGDDLRYVDWNIYRRLERLLLKVFTSEEEMNIYLLVDTSRSMNEGAPAKLDYAKKVAAALGYIGLKNLDRVGGAPFATRLHTPLTLGRGRKQILSLFHFLARLHGDGKTDLRAAAHAFTNLFPQPGFVVILSDLFDPAGWRAALEELALKRYQVLVVHIIDQRESEPAHQGDLALIDVEDGRERKLFLDAELVRRYRAELAGYFKEIETVCSSRGIDYLRTSTAVPFEEFVLQTLRQVSGVS
jgi:uncharacterized protein (DUF58 family)